MLRIASLLVVGILSTACEARADVMFTLPAADVDATADVAALPQGALVTLESADFSASPPRPSAVRVFTQQGDVLRLPPPPGLFTNLAAGKDGTLFVASDSEVLRLPPGSSSWEVVHRVVPERQVVDVDAGADGAVLVASVQGAGGGPGTVTRVEHDGTTRTVLSRRTLRPQAIATLSTGGLAIAQADGEVIELGLGRGTRRFGAFGAQINASPRSPAVAFSVRCPRPCASSREVVVPRNSPVRRRSATATADPRRGRSSSRSAWLC